MAGAGSVLTLTLFFLAIFIALILGIWYFATPHEKGLRDWLKNSPVIVKLLAGIEALVTFIVGLDAIFILLAIL